MSRDWSWYLLDMVEAAERAVTHLGTLDAEHFAEDRKTQAAVERELAILGEAAKKIPESVRNAHPEVHWREMAGLRDVLNHVYFQVDALVLWRLVREDLPGDIEALQAMIPVPEPS